MKDTKHIRWDISFCRLSHAPGVGFRGAGGAQGIKKIFSSNMVMLHIKSTGDDEQNRMQVKFSS